MSRRAFWRAWMARLRGSVARRALDREMDEEMRFHVDMATERNVRAGRSPVEARRRALLAFGSAEVFKEDARDALRARPLENLLGDVGFALRSLRKAPAFTAVGVATLALGIGGTVTVYAALRTLLVEPLPFRAAEELVLVRGRNALRGRDVLPASYPDFRDWRESGLFLELAAWTSYPGSTGALAEGSGDPEEVQLAYVSENFFRTLGVQAVAGQAFLPEDGEPGSPATVVLAHSLWRRRFAADPSVVGAALSIEGKSFTVRGVLPATFRFAAYPRDAELYVTLAHEPNPARQRSRGTRYLGTIGRLPGGADAATAESQLAPLAERIAAENAVNEGYAVEVAPLREVLLADRRASLHLLAGGCLVLLLIATVNVANLFLARAASRGRELAVRNALGGSRRRLVELFLAESLVLGLAGGVAGVVLALLGTGVLAPLLRRAPSYLAPFDLVGAGIALDWTAGLVALTAALGAGVLVALGTLPQLSEQLAAVPGSPSSRGTEPRGALRLRRRLVALETALATVLLVSAGLLGRSLWTLRATDPGFSPDGLFAADVRLSPQRYRNPASVDGFWDAALERLGAGDRAAAVEVLPLGGADQSTGLFVDGTPPPPPAERPQVHHRVVSAGYFGLMSVPLVAGRDFRPGDGRQGGRVAIVNATLARRLFPEGDALGRRVALDFEAFDFPPDGPPRLDPDRGYRTIVGVVGDVRFLGLDQEPRPELYVPLEGASARMLTLVFRARSGGSATADVRRAVSEVDPGQTVGRVRSLPAVVASSSAAPASRTAVLGVFAGVALLLAAVGVYGMVTFSISRRRKDLGIRVALGASRLEIAGEVVSEALRPVLAALGPGLLGAWIAARALRGMLHETAPLDPWTFTLVPAFLLLVAFAAGAVPARRAAAVDPAEVMRSE